MVTGHLEMESKYDVDEQFVLPGLGGLPGGAVADEPVEHQLDAVYHDTPDLRLLRARVTLRRRTGGPDAGWHLKLPAGTARRELHAPLGRAVKNPPEALTGPVVGILRGAKTVPVVALRTRRIVTVLRDERGEPVAEVADDAVTATLFAPTPDEPTEVQVWREVEVELADRAGEGKAREGEAVAAAVGERLVAAGARPSAAASKVGRALAGRLAAGAARAVPPAVSGRRTDGPCAGEFVLAALGEQVADLQAADVLLRTDQPDAVHRLRVAARRLRSTLAAFRGVFDERATTALREELRWLGGQLAGVRDDEVALGHLRELVDAQPEELVLGPVAARLQQTGLQEAQAGLDRALLTVSERRYLELLDALHSLMEEPPYAAAAGDPLRAVLGETVRRAARRMRRRLRTARRTPPARRAEALHAVRTAAKRVRYVGEVASGELGGTKALVRSAKRVQEVLGQVQDSVVSRELCRRLGTMADAAGENGFTYGRLHALEEARAARAEERFWALAPQVRRVAGRAGG